MSAIRIEPASEATYDAWFALRRALWPTCPDADHDEEMRSMLDEPEQFVAVVARTTDDRVVGFAEGSLRYDYVNGCETSPVAFLEGIYVAPEGRRRGVAAQLIAAIAAWGRSHDCAELASDAELHNTDSQAMHLALGFAETERVVYFRKMLTDDADTSRR